MNITTEMKVLGGVLVVTLLIVIGGAFLVGGTPTNDAEPVAAELLVRENSHSLGPVDAAVTVVEFGDFECPACGSLHPILQQLKAANKDAPVRFVYRHFPLSQHPNAQLAAEASVEAARQGKFWEMHDELFANQNNLDRASLEKYAAKIGLNMAAFTKALDDNTHRGVVLDDRTDGQAAQVDSTPTVFINGVRFTGQYSVSSLQAAIDENRK